MESRGVSTNIFVAILRKLTAFLQVGFWLLQQLACWLNPGEAPEPEGQCRPIMVR